MELRNVPLKANFTIENTLDDELLKSNLAMDVFVLVMASPIKVVPLNNGSFVN